MTMEQKSSSLPMQARWHHCGSSLNQSTYPLSADYTAKQYHVTCLPSFCVLVSAWDLFICYFFNTADYTTNVPSGIVKSGRTLLHLTWF